MSDIENIIANIGTVIRTRRKRLGMTQPEVPQITGLQRQMISRVEAGNGAVAVAVATVARVAVVVGLYLSVTPRYDDGRS